MKCDMHVHCKKQNADEAYTAAKNAGMDLVAITDHHKIDNALILKSKYPDEIIVGVEITIKDKVKEYGSYKLDILLYEVTQRVVTDLNNLRKNFKGFMDYVNKNNLLAVPAHHTTHLNNVPSEWFYKYFHTFEGINFSKDLSYCKTLWNKGKKLIGGSDAHWQSRVGKVYTIVDNANNINEFMKGVKEGRIELGIKI